MHSFTHHTHEETGERQTVSTRGMIMNMGWRYDLLTGVLDTVLLRGKLQKIRQQTIELARLQNGNAVLDVGCGTGTLALAAYKQVGSQGRVCGIDPGFKQIARARSKAKRSGSTIDFQLGVIEQLPFSDHSFDVVLSTLVMHHLPDDLKRLGLAEIVRVLKPGGRLVIVDFKRAEPQRGKPAHLGAGALGLQEYSPLLEDAGFLQLKSGDMQFPHLMEVGGVGFIIGSASPV